MKKVLLLFILLIPSCAPRITPQEFSFPLNEKKRIELEGSPVSFRDGLCITDKGWSADIKNDRVSFGYKAQAISLPKRPEKIKGTKGNVWGKLMEGDRIYFGTDTGFLYCMRRRKTLWKRRIGGGVVSSPAMLKNLVLFSSLDGHIYCLKKTTGSILWIKDLPGRGKFSPIVIGEVILIPSLSNKIIGLDEKGNKEGEFEIDGTLRFPLYRLGNSMVAVSYDWEDEKTIIQELEKKFGVEITFEPESPINLNDTVEITAKTYGFSSPVVEFLVDGKSVQEGEEKKLMWMAEKAGEHRIKVIAKGAEGEKEAEETLNVLDPEEEWLKQALKVRKNCYWKR